MKMLKFLALSLFLGLLYFGCVPEPDNGALIKDMVVQTKYNTDFINQNDTIFKHYATFVMRKDTMGFVSTISNANYLTEDQPYFVKPVVNAIRTNFLNVGYDTVSIADDPDFSVNVIVLQNFSYYQTVNYGGYGYPGSYYYGYYNYYYPTVSTYAADYVTLVIQVVDAKNIFNSEYPVIWTAYIGDLNATLDLPGKTLEAIETAFQQSPYIQKNP